MNNKRKFGGKAYLLSVNDTGYSNKMKAKSAAVQLRREGYNVRIVKDPVTRTYSLYRRHTTRFI
jgi:hypothetical protein